MHDQQPLEHERLDTGFPPRSKGIGCGLLVIALIVGSVVITDRAKHDYTIRAQVSEGLNLAHRVRVAVEGYVEDYGELPANNEDAGLPPASEISGSYVSQIGIEDGEIVIVYGKKIDTRVVGKTIVLVPDVSNHPDISWTCSSPDIPNKWLTSACR